MHLILQIFYSILSGALLALAIPNEIYLLGMPVITLVAIIPLYLAIKKCKSYRETFIVMFTQTITTHLLSSFWLAYFKDFAALTLGASAFGTGLIGGFTGLFFHIPYTTESQKSPLSENYAELKFYQSTGFRIFYFAAIYTFYEWVKSSGFLGYPWGTISSATYNWHVLAQLSAITGTYGISFFIVVINCILAETFQIYLKGHSFDFYVKKLKFLLQTTTIFTILILSYGIYQFYVPRTPEKKVTAIIVQQNADPWKQSSDKETILLSQKLTKETLDELEKENKKADFIVWSEGCLKQSFPNAKNYYKTHPEEYPLFDFVKDSKTTFIFGAPYLRNRKNRIYHNSAVVIDKEGNFRGYYGKNHLVPFAEVVPGMNVPAIRNFMQKIIGISAGWTPGDQYTLFDIPCEWSEKRILPESRIIDVSKSYESQQKDENKKPVVTVAAPICFDDSFTDIMRPLWKSGAELFVNLTDDSWSLKKSSEYQHFAVSSFRAIEYRTSVVRSTNSGYSVALDPTGRIIKDLPLFKASSTFAEIPVYKRTVTTYARWGNWFVHLLLVLIAIYSVYAKLNFQKSDYIPSERKIKNKKSKKHKNKHKK